MEEIDGRRDDDHGDDLGRQQVEHVVTELEDEGHVEPVERRGEDEGHGEGVVAVEKSAGDELLAVDLVYQQPE